MKSLLWALIGVALGLGACRPASTAQSPDAVLQAYAAALKDGDTAAAYDLLSADARREISFEAFERMLREHPDEIQHIAEKLGGTPSRRQMTATVTAADGQVLDLVYEDGQWRATRESIDLYGQSTPRHALAAFVRAFEAKRFDVLISFVPEHAALDLSEDQLRAAWEGPQKEQMQQIVEGLSAALETVQVEQVADRATASYGVGKAVLLVRERGLWKIEEFENAAYSTDTSSD